MWSQAWRAIPASVLVAARIPAYSASGRLFRICTPGEPRTATAARLVIFANSWTSLGSAMAAVSAMPTVSEQVHRDERDADQHPEPIRNQPLHNIILEYVKRGQHHIVK